MLTDLGASKGLLQEVVEDFIREKKEEDPNNPYIKEILQSQDDAAGSDGHGFSNGAMVANLRRSLEELDSRRRVKRGYALLERASPFINTLTGMMAQCEQVLQAAPLGASIAFTGIRVVLQLAVKVQDYLDLVLDAIDQISDILTVYNIHSSNCDFLPGFRERLIRAYKAVITFWFKISKTLHHSTFKKVAIRNLKKPLFEDIRETTSSLRRDMTIIGEMSQAERAVQSRLDGELRLMSESQQLRRDIRAWIMGDSHSHVTDDQKTNLSCRQEGTCSWIFDDTRFQGWRDAKHTSTLWYNAPPGSGKSILASTVIDHLEKDAKDVAYYFYSFNKPLQKRYLQCLRSLALQLFQFVGTIPDKLVNIYEKERESTLYMEGPFISAAVILALSTVARKGQVYIALDGLDECTDKDQLEHLRPLIQFSRSSNASIKWLITSRNDMDIRKTMEALEAVELCPEREVIEKDIATYFKANQNYDNASLEYVQGNFLHAKYVVTELKGYSSPKEKAEILKSFPKSLNSYYARVLLRLEADNRYRQNAARRIVQILTGTFQSITLDEVVDILAIDHKAVDYDPTGVPDRELVHQLWGPILVFDRRGRGTEENPIVRLCHKSVEDFFLENPDGIDASTNPALKACFTTRQKASEELGKDCLAYLQYSRYRKNLDLKAILEKRVREHAFLPYAATFWFQHLGEIPPTPDLEASVAKFLRCKAFWTCLRVQSYVSPYLFGWYAGRSKSEFDETSRFKMTIRSQQWRTGGFGLPLPEWLGTTSTQNGLLDYSFCCFTNEWREVLITCPEGINLCMPLRHADPTCHLMSPEKAKRAWVAHLDETSDMKLAIEMLSLELHFVGRKLHADALYRKRDAQDGAVTRLRIPLFSNKPPIMTTHHLPLDDLSDWTVGVVEGKESGAKLEAWSVDAKKPGLRQTTQDRSIPHRIPVSWTHHARGSERGHWSIVPANASDDRSQANPVRTFQVTWSQLDKESSHILSAHPDETSDDDESSDIEEVQFSDDEDDEDHSEEVQQWSDDDEADTAESSCDTDDDDDAKNHDIDVDTEPKGEPSIENAEESSMSCLVLKPHDGHLYWTMPWVMPPEVHMKIIPAVHPNLPLVVFTPEVHQLEVVDLEKRAQTTVALPELADPDKSPAARLRELHFSPDGQYLHLLSITYEDAAPNTTCHVAVVTYEVRQGDITPASPLQLTELRARRCVYTLADRLCDLVPQPLPAPSSFPLALTYWPSSSPSTSSSSAPSSPPSNTATTTNGDEGFVLVALPPLTCDAKIIKVPLGLPASSSSPAGQSKPTSPGGGGSAEQANGTDTDDDKEGGGGGGEGGPSILTLREPIYFPGTTPRRSACLRLGAASGPGETYIYLGLGALAEADGGGGAGGGGGGSPPVVLRWHVAADGWRGWDSAEDGRSLVLKRGVPAWKILRGGFVDSDKSFSVPIRCSLDWTRKAFLTCG